MDAEKVIVIYSGGVDDAIEEACEKFGCSPDEVNHRIIEEGKKGFLGIVSKPWRVKVWHKSLGDEEPITEDQEEKKDRTEDAEIDVVSPKKKAEKIDSSSSKDEEKPSIAPSNNLKPNQDSEAILEDVEQILSDIQEIKINLDGFAEIQKTPQGIYLVVYKPKGDGQSVDYEHIQQKIDLEGVLNVDYEAVRQAFENDDEQPVRIADYDPTIYIDGDCTVEASPDGMELSVTLIPPDGGNPVMLEEVEKKIKDLKIKVEYDSGLIQKNIDNKLCNTPFVVAYGIEAEAGEDAKIEYKFDLDSSSRGTEQEDGSIDFKELNMIINVLKGEVIGEKIPATEGVEGKDIFGKAIPPLPGKDEVMKMGNNVELSEDGLKLVASVDGQLRFDGDKPSIFPVFVVKGDVDLHTGNIDFIGNVIVEGSVLDGFSIKAQGSVEVQSTIGAANVEATGDITVRGGIVGKTMGSVSSDGNIFAKFIENSTVRARGTIKVERSIMHSTVRCTRLELIGDKSSIMGGTVTVADEILTKSIGSSGTGKTTIIVGVDEGLLKQLNDIEEAIRGNQQSLDKLKKAVDMLELLQSRTGNLPEDKEQVLIKTKAMFNQTQATVKSLEATRFEIDEKVNSSKGGRIKASQSIFPGTVITIRKAVMHVKDELRYSTLTYENGYIKINPFS